MVIIDFPMNVPTIANMPTKPNPAIIPVINRKGLLLSLLQKPCVKPSTRAGIIHNNAMEKLIGTNKKTGIKA